MRAEGCNRSGGPAGSLSFRTDEFGIVVAVEDGSLLECASLTIDDGSPFVVVETTIAGGTAGLDALLQDVSKLVVINRTGNVLAL